MFTILHTEASTGWGGQEIRILLEAVGMAKRGHRLIISAPEGSGLWRKATDEGIMVVHERFKKNPLSVWRMHHLIQKEKVDIVNTHSSSDSWVATIAARLSGVKPAIIRTRHLGLPVSRSFSTRLIYNVLPHALMTTGEETRRQMIEMNGFDGARIVSVPTGVDLDRFDPQRVNPCLERNGFVVGMVSVLRYGKGHHYFLKAIPAILESIPEATFVIVGDGPRYQNIKEMIEEMALADKVRMLGHMDEVPEIMASLDVLVHPSYPNEGVAQSIVQALAMKKAVVASDVGATKEVVIDGETGVLIHPKDLSQIAEKVIQLYRDPMLRERLGARGRELVAKKCSLDKMLDRIEELYVELRGPCSPG